MKPKTYDNLTWAAVNAFGDRKQAGRFSVVVDVKTKDVYPIPRDIEHRDYICTILHTTPEDISQNPNLAARLVPVHIDLNPEGSVNEIITGISGFEDFYKVRHTQEDLNAAHTRAKEFVMNGEIQCKEDLEGRIDSRYVLSSR